MEEDSQQMPKYAKTEAHRINRSDKYSRKRVMQIIQRDQRSRKNIIFSKYQMMDRQQTIQYIFSLCDVILLTLLQLFEKRVTGLYQEEDYALNMKKYFAIFETEANSIEYLIAESKLYRMQQFSKFQEEYAEKMVNADDLPEYIWVKGLKNGKKIENDLIEYEMSYSYLQGNFLIQKVEEKSLQLSVVLEKIKQNEAQAKIDYISKYLLIELHEEYANLSRIFSTIQQDLNAANIYRRTYTDPRIHFLLEFENIFDLLLAKAKIDFQKIPFQYVSSQIFDKQIIKYEHLCSQDSSFGFSIKKLNKQFIQSDILSLQRRFNTTQNQQVNHLHFMLDNWQAYQPFCQKDLELYQDILMSYTNVDKSSKDDQKVQKTFQRFDKKYTVIAEEAQKLLPKFKTINQYQGNPDELISLFKQRKSNSLFSIFVQNLELMSAKQGQINVTEEGQEKQRCIHDVIANLPQYQYPSNKGARWEGLFSKVYTHHYLNMINKKQIQEEERHLDITCLGCCPFFYENQNIKFSDINSTPVQIISTAQEIQHPEEQKKIKQVMRRFMNEHGGIILFDCRFKSLQFLPKGLYMSPTRQEQISKKFEEYFQALINEESDQKIQKEIIVRFVPVARNPFRVKKKTNKFYVEDTYVTRVKINRSLAKNAQVYMSQLQERQSIFEGPIISYFHKGPCADPEASQKKQKSQKSYKVSKKSIENIPPQPQYTYISLLIAKQKNRGQVQRRLKQKIQQNPQYQYKIQLKYEQQKFKCAANTAFFRHNIELKHFKQLFPNTKDKQRLASFTQITFLISVPDRSRMKYNIKQKDFYDMIKFSPKTEQQLAKEEVIYWRHSNSNDPDYYFQVKGQDKMKGVLLYYILHSSSQKAKFRLPKDYQTFKQTDVVQKFSIQFKANTTKTQLQLKNELFAKFQQTKLLKFKK